MQIIVIDYVTIQRYVQLMIKQIQYLQRKIPFLKHENNLAKFPHKRVKDSISIHCGSCWCAKAVFSSNNEVKTD